MAVLHPDGFWYSADEYLNQEQMDVNAVFVAMLLYHKHGWTLNAIAAILGNMQTESKINPALWENRTDYEAAGEDPLDNKHGFGLVQWTPWGKYTDYAERHGLERIHIASQLQRIQAEVDNDLQWISTSEFPMTFTEFTKSTDTPYNLACVFVRNYERPNITSETYEERGSQADYYYKLIKKALSGTNPNALNQQAIIEAVAWAVAIANDDSHGYDQTSRWGPDYDCSSLLIQAYENAGIPVKTNGAVSTANMRGAFMKTGFMQLTWKSGMELVAGDVLWREGHCAMFIGDGNIVSAHINELGATTGGATGDQTGNEINVSSYDASGTWDYVMRLPTYDFSYGMNKHKFKLLFYAAACDLI